MRAEPEIRRLRRREAALPSRTGERTLEQFALDLQAHQKKKQGHEPIIDPMFQIFREYSRANPNFADRVEKCSVLWA
jgi:hypothetical protein